MAHEAVHRATCLDLNGNNTVSLPEGGTVELGTIDTIQYPPSPYAAWGQYPPNHSADEILGYMQDVTILSEFVQNYCM